MTKPLLCGVGRLVEAKGFDLLIEAFEAIDANLLIIGDGSLKKTLQKAIERFGLQRRVKLTGHRTDATEIMGGVDGLVISSRREGFSYVFAEALLAKCPIIATDVPVCNEFLPRHLLTATTVSSIRTRLIECLDHPDSWRAEMSVPFARAEQELTLAGMAERTLAFYRKIVV